MDKVWAVVPAAGTGSRMGSQVKKQFLKLNDTPILIMTLQLLASMEELQGIVLVTSKDDMEACEKMCSDYRISKTVYLTEGGATRQASVLNGLCALKELGKASPDDIVMIHDAARPLALVEEIRATVEAAKAGGAALLAAPVKDTVKVAAKDGTVQTTPERSALFGAQTPQTFRLGDITSAHHLAAEREDFNCTDDSQIMEKYGKCPVRIIQGSYENIKITTPVDLIIAEKIMEERNSHGR